MKKDDLDRDRKRDPWAGLFSFMFGEVLNLSSKKLAGCLYLWPAILSKGESDVINHQP